MGKVLKSLVCTPIFLIFMVCALCAAVLLTIGLWTEQAIRELYE